MAILPGRRLGPYEILSAIGAGGMGEVYKARDTRLDRIVAIKVVPTHLADRSELRERFDREAKTIASLNHPHICVLYDIGHQDGTDYLVMEYLEGETLAQRLVKGALPIQQALQFAIEISDALDKAHRKGITHRDLKPGNIMLTKSGTKLLDFGLAKLTQEGAPAVPDSQLPTMKSAVTAEGTILGTLQYMAPEQVEGKQNEIDARTDIFAFGAVVYEMATGKKAFEGKTSASVMAKILEAEPPSMVSLQPMTPPALDRVVRKGLAKEPDQRWQTASDLCGELKWIAESGLQKTIPPSVLVKQPDWIKRREIILGLGTFLLGAAIASMAVWTLKHSPPQPVIRAVITLPPGQQLAALDNGPSLAISPDGSHLAYVAIPMQGGRQQLYLRAMDSLEIRPIPGSAGATQPVFSPDGEWVGFSEGGKLKKVSVSGGVALSLSDASVPRGISWGGQGLIALGSPSGGGLQEVPDAGGATQPLTHFEKAEAGHRWPEFLPGGKAVLFSVGTGTNSEIAVESVGPGELRHLIPIGTQPRYASSGQLIFAQGGNLMAVAFDPQRFKVTGTPVPVLEGIVQSSASGAAQYSISASGSLVYIPGTVQGNKSRLVWVSRGGTEQPLAAPERAYGYPRLSPDGRRIAVGITDQGTQVWVYDLYRETLTRLTFEGQTNDYPAWTADGKRIAFRSDKEGPGNVFWQLADGSGGLVRLTTSVYLQSPYSWSKDGHLLAFMEINPTTGFDIWVLHTGDPLADSKQTQRAEPFIRTQFNESVPRFSPDGRWLAYISDESGRYEIYVQPYPGPGGKWQISTEGGTEPAWNPNGRELFYRSGDKMMAVEIATEPSFTAGKPRMLFEGSYRPTSATFPNYDVSPDGQRFLMLKPSEEGEAARSQINIVLNWFEELKQKVPTGKK